MASSSLFFRIVDSGAYSSFRASTTEFLISSSLGNSSRSFATQSPVVLPGGIASDVSARPVRSRALAKNRTLISMRSSSSFSSGPPALGSPAIVGAPSAAESPVRQASTVELGQGNAEMGTTKD